MFLTIQQRSAHATRDNLMKPRLHGCAAFCLWGVLGEDSLMKRWRSRVLSYPIQGQVSV
jgi:hypothetical protein